MHEDLEESKGDGAYLPSQSSLSGEKVIARATARRRTDKEFYK
jgi:hypothetical protein